MAVLDFARARAAGAARPSHPANRAMGANRQQTPMRIAVEVGGTFLVLMLIAAGLLALRLVLVLANGALH